MHFYDKMSDRWKLCRRRSRDSCHSSNESESHRFSEIEDNSLRFGISKAMNVVLLVILCGLLCPASLFYYCNECTKSQNQTNPLIRNCSQILEIEDIQTLISSKFMQNESLKKELYSWIVIEHDDLEVEDKIDEIEDCRQTKYCQEKLEHGEGVLFKELVRIAPKEDLKNYNQTHRFVDRCVGSCKSENRIYQNIGNYTTTFSIKYNKKEINSTEILIHTECKCVCNPIIKRDCNKTTHEYSEEECTCIRSTDCYEAKDTAVSSSIDKISTIAVNEAQK